MAGKQQAYSTIVAQRGVSATKSLRAKAKEQARKVEAAKQRQQYGAAMGGVSAQAYRTAEARTGAMVNAAKSRVAEAKTNVLISQQSQEMDRERRQALNAANSAQIARTIQAGQPALISARSAMAQAEAYAKQVGIDMKKMDWSARANIASSIIDNNMEMVKMQFQNQLQLDAQQQMYDLQTKLANDAKLEGAPAVVSTVTAALPNMMSKYSELINSNAPEQAGWDPAAEALNWAKTQSNDQNAIILLQDIFLKTLQQGPANTIDGVMDQSFLQSTVQQSVMNSYPGWNDYASTVGNALTPGVLNSQLGANIERAANPGNEGWFVTSPKLGDTSNNFSFKDRPISATAESFVEFPSNFLNLFR